MLLDAAGDVAALGPTADLQVPEGLPRVGGPEAWIGPGIVDAHVHLAFGSAAELAAAGVVAVRDLGAPAPMAQAVRSAGGRGRGAPYVEVAGPLLTAPGGYPSTSWGRDGFAHFVDSPASARAAVRLLIELGVDVVKVALEPAGGQPTPSADVVRAIVDAAHAAGLGVTAHALTVAMVHRALDAGVDELCHTPTERLTPADVERVVDARVPVVSTLQTFFSGGGADAAADNAAALVAAGAELVYGTDLGNAGTSAGVDARELSRLAAAGLGPLGALRAATEGSARLLTSSPVSGRIERGRPASLVVLAADPLRDPRAWAAPLHVVVDGETVTG